VPAKLRPNAQEKKPRVRLPLKKKRSARRAKLRPNVPAKKPLVRRRNKRPNAPVKNRLAAVQ
jgi:hypothetical protein